jgi:hypothetical protein
MCPPVKFCGSTGTLGWDVAVSSSLTATCTALFHLPADPNNIVSGGPFSSSPKLPPMRATMTSTIMTGTTMTSTAINKHGNDKHDNDKRDADGDKHGNDKNDDDDDDDDPPCLIPCLATEHCSVPPEAKGNVTLVHTCDWPRGYEPSVLGCILDLCATTCHHYQTCSVVPGEVTCTCAQGSLPLIDCDVTICMPDLYLKTKMGIVWSDPFSG